MAYARLVFDTNITPLQKIKDMVKFCTGGVSSVTDLEFASQVSSEIIITEAPGWTIADVASTLEASGTATIATYRLTSTCVDTNKSKYCEFRAQDRGHDDLTTVTSTTYPATLLTSASTTGALFVPIGSGTTGTALNNPVYYYDNLYNYDTNDWLYTQFRSIDLGVNVSTYYLSVTARKLLIFAEDPSTPAVIMNLEFPETHATTTYNNVPYAFFQWWKPTTARTVTQVVWPYTGTYNKLYHGNTPSDGYFYLTRMAFVTNWYRPYDKTTGVRLVDDCLDQMFAPVDPSVIINPSTSEIIYPLVEIIDERSRYGEGVHNYSTLTNVYWSKDGLTGDTISFNGDEYALLHFTSSSRSLAIKKA